jgi:DNA-directed RNA polymerase subunit RPC12/RpoP
MLRLVCPGCKKDSYSSEVESFNTCPYCGIRFSGKYGTDKRIIGRREWEIPFVFSHKESKCHASTIDFSEKGLGIKVLGNPMVTPGEIIEFMIGDTQVKAKIIWVKNLPDQFNAGLRKLN